MPDAVQWSASREVGIEGSPRRASQLPALPLVLAASAWVVVVVFALVLAWLLAGHATGLDMKPLRNAAIAVRAGEPVYVQGFVYPPTAALVALPLSMLSFRTAVAVFSSLEVVVVLLTLLVMLPLTLPPSRWTLAGAAAICAMLLAGDVIGYGALKDDNASFLVLLPLALIIVCWASGRWNVGALILAATLLVKPLLLPLLLVPILARRWRATALAAGVTVLGLLLSFPLARGASGPMEVLKRLSRGSGLTGSSSKYNMSLGGLGEWRHLPEGLVLSARIAIALVAIASIVAVWRLRPPMTLGVIGPLTGVLLGATFLAGPLSEKTYVPLLLPAALTCLLARRHVITGLVIAGGLVAAYNSKLFGIGYNGTAWQLRFVTVEVLVFAASTLALRVAVLSGLPDDSPRESWGTLVQTLFREARGVSHGPATTSAAS